MWNNSSSLLHCLENWEPKSISLSSSIVKFVLILPPSVYVLFLGFKQCRRQQTSLKTTSHSDYFTFHMISLQLISALAMATYFWGYFNKNEVLIEIGFYSNTATHTMEMEVHCLICVDRYLAVVHPVTYLKLRKTSGKRLRNTAIACSWLISFAFLGIVQMKYPYFPVEFFSCFLGVSLGVIGFCSVSVLCVLIRPGPSDVARVDQSKRKAFNMISAIMGVQFFWLTGILICMTLQYSSLSEIDKCFVFISTLVFNIPSQSVLPLLYLMREGKLPCSRK